jgi:hypothetical protein
LAKLEKRNSIKKFTGWSLWEHTWLKLVFPLVSKLLPWALVFSCVRQRSLEGLMKMTLTRSQRSFLIVATITAGQTMAPLTSLADPVRIAGQQAFVVTTGGAARTSTVQKNIDNALVAAKNHTPATINVVHVKGQPVITLGGFYVMTVDAASAKALHTTQTLLAQKWANGLRASLKNQQAVEAYVAQLTGSTSASAGTTTTNAGSYPYYRQGRLIYIPAGMTIPVVLSSAISSQSAHIGDAIEGKIAQTVDLGDTSIPSGSVITGKVTESTAGERMGHAGMLGMKFDTLHTPDGQSVPITAHIIGGIGKYKEIGSQSNLLAGESSQDKMKQALIRGGIGAGSGAVLGTAIGAMSTPYGYGAGRGAISGTVIGGALGVAESLLLRKGNDVNVTSGQTLNLQLDAPASLAVSGQAQL